ncbi:MAG: histidine--tRNA ligase [Rickettsiales bacterium]|nr:histidine--tRNA ligase [Rickettsiales bacterium]
MKIQKLQPVKGTKDILLEEGNLFSHIVKTVWGVAKIYGYGKAQLPIFEFTEVFKRTLGEVSDVVNKEMYTFEDKGGRSITLRPEFTAGIVRSVISNNLWDRLPLKIFTSGSLFRYENPQKGRYRQFNQINLENIGARSPMIDAEIIALAKEILDKLNLSNITLEINSLGDIDSRKKYSEDLVEYLGKYADDLSEDSQVRLVKNPLRILDSKDTQDQRVLQYAPRLKDYLTNESLKFFEDVLKYLDDLNIKYSVNNKIVRGLDYYTDTVFEFVTKELGAQGTVIAGGRYDGLFKLMGGRDTPAIGFAGGLERLMALYKEALDLPKIITVLILDKKFSPHGLKLVQKIRQHNIIATIEESKNIGKSIKRSLDDNAKFIVFLGEEEVKQGKVKLKNLETREEKLVAESELMKILK